MISLKDKSIYYTLIILSIIFTVCDLAVTCGQLLVPSLIFSSLSMVVGFIGAQKAKALALETEIDKTIEFVKSNFSKSNIIFSICDVVCCILALFTGIFIIALISRSVIALRLVIIINKYKTVAFGIWSFVFIYLFKRGEKKKMAENENITATEKKTSFFKKVWEKIKSFGKLVWANKKSLCGTIIGLLGGVTAAITANADAIIALPHLMIGCIDMTAIIVGVLVFAGIEIGVVGKGFETVKDFIARVTVKKEEQATVKAEKAEIKAAKKAEKAEAQKVEKAKALLEQRKKEAEAEAKAAAEKAEIEALANTIAAEEAKKAAEAQATANADKPTM